MPAEKQRGRSRMQADFSIFSLHVSRGSGGAENRLEKWGLPSSEHATDRGSCFFQSFMATSRHKQASRVAVMGGGA